MPLLPPSVRRALLVLPLAAAAAHAQTMGGTSNIYSGTGFTIPDLTTRTSSINVAGFGAAQAIEQNAQGQSVVVRLNGLTHTWAGDVWATLGFTPVGSMTTFSMGLFFRPGQGVGNPPSTFGSSKVLNGNYSFGEYVIGTTFEADFVDFARFAVPTTIAPGDYYTTSTGGGEYASPFGTYGGLNPNGTWTLTMRDEFAGDTGNLTSWELGLSVSSPQAVVPEPSTYVLLVTGLGVLAGVARRRRQAA